MKNLIEVQNLTKDRSSGNLGSRRRDSPNRQGRVCSHHGTLGLWQATLLYILGMLDSATSGQFILNGEDVAQASESERNRMRKGLLGYVFQSFNLVEELTVEENINLPLLYMGIPATEHKIRVEEAMQRMDIAHRAKHFPRQISGGQQQRTAIARAIVTRPQLILADEPTGNLDSKNGKEVMNLLSELHRDGATVVMVTHSRRDAGYAERIINPFDGKVTAEESV